MAAAVSGALTFLATSLAPRIGIMDMPNALGIHNTPTPRTGGIAIFVGVLIACIAALMGMFPLSPLQSVQLLGLLLGGGILAAVGLLDDMRRIAPEVKFCWEILGALVALVYGVQMELLPLLWLALPVTVLFLVGGANAVNLIDGMDGLAGGVGALAALFLGAMALLEGNSLVALFCAVILGSILGFLPFNLHPAKTFMGDCGSLQIGFLLTACALLLSSQPYNWVMFLAPLSVLSLPFLDTAAALVRRRMGRSDMFDGDRRHIYDLLARRCASYWQTVVLMWAACIALGIAGLAAAVLGGSWALVLIGLVAAVGLAGAWRLGVFFPDVAGSSQERTDLVSGTSPVYVSGRGVS